MFLNCRISISNDGIIKRRKKRLAAAKNALGVQSIVLGVYLFRLDYHIRISTLPLCQLCVPSVRKVQYHGSMPDTVGAPLWQPAGDTITVT